LSTRARRRVGKNEKGKEKQSHRRKGVMREEE